MTPKKAIKLYCINFCLNGHRSNMCNSLDCSLYNILNNKGKRSLSSIKARCKDCEPDSRNDVINCKDKKCFLYQYRLGHNPARAGIGLKGSKLAENTNSRKVFTT